jgi:hypothetical protein
MTIRRRRGTAARRGPGADVRRIAASAITGFGCAAMPAVTAWPQRLSLSSSAGAPMCRRRCCAHAGAVHGLWTTRGELAASELG